MGQYICRENGMSHGGCRCPKTHALIKCPAPNDCAKEKARTEGED